MATQVAVVGAGLMGRWHAHACRLAGGRVAAVVDPDVEAARAMAAKHPRATVARTLDELAPELRPDLVHVCSPPETHEVAARQAFRRGCPVLVEKPAAPTAEATARLIEAAAEAGVWIEAAHQLVFQHGVQRARSWLASAGALRTFDYAVCSAGAERQPARADAIASEILPHPLSLVDVLVPGGLESVDRWSARRRAPGELTAASGAGPTAVRLSVSMSGRPPRHELTLVAERGTLTLDLFHGFAWEARGGVSRTGKLVRPFAASASCAFAAASNLARRTARREWAYPGLLALVLRTYAALARPAARPLGDRHLLAVARAREEIVVR